MVWFSRVKNMMGEIWGRVMWKKRFHQPAPSISAALVTTVVGLLIAIPGVIAFNRMNATIRNIMSDMEGFADELTGRIACEYQGRGA